MKKHKEGVLDYGASLWDWRLVIHTMGNQEFEQSM